MSVPNRHHVLVTGATGYLGRALLPRLQERGHVVRALVRAGSAGKLPAGVEARIGDALQEPDVRAALAGCDTLVHLVGVPKPSPAKAREFRSVDLVSVQAASRAAAAVSPRPHFIYLSVAQPAPVMRAYLEVRAAGEAMIRAAGVPATFLRPWYVLGPGHRWPLLVLPAYWLLELWPGTRASARRLGFVTLAQMVSALVRAVERGAEGVSVVDVPAIRATG